MKKIITISVITILAFFVSTDAFGVCLQCPEIQKQLKKELNLSKEQKKEIKQITKDMEAQIKEYQKAYKKNQKQINKILKADCPDIVKMMDYKTQNAKIKKDIMLVKKEAQGRIFEVYTEEQQYRAKQVLSENTNIKTKGKCKFCNDNSELKPKCAKCNNKK